jgi:hypothetical protein
MSSAVSSYYNARAQSSISTTVFLVGILALIIPIVFLYSIKGCDHKDSFLHDTNICKIPTPYRIAISVYFITIGVLHIYAQTKLKKLPKDAKSQDVEAAEKLQKYTHYASIPFYIFLVLIALAIIISFSSGQPLLFCLKMCCTCGISK